jgi:hypothetical protein
MRTEAEPFVVAFNVVAVRSKNHRPVIRSSE